MKKRTQTSKSTRGKTFEPYGITIAQPWRPMLDMAAILLLGSTFAQGCSESQTEAVAVSKAKLVGSSCINTGTGKCWPYCTSPSCARGIAADASLIRTRYEAWRDRHVLNHGYPTGGTDQLRVWKSDPTGSDQNTTVSEGQAYGMLFAVLFDEQDIFDKLWKFATTHLDSNGLMNWCVKQDNTLCSSAGGATDADVDFALALVFANKKVSSGAWNPSPTWSNYQTQAQSYLNAIFSHEISAAGYTLAGDTWSGGLSSNVLNPSYFSPGHYRVFDAFENGTRWATPTAKIYANINAIQANHGKCTKLVYNWSDPSGAPNYAGGDANLYSFDATRTPARVVLDKLWFGTPEAAQTLDEIGGFFKQVGVPVGMQYNMEGVCLQCGTSAAQPTFTATNAIAIWGADNPINPGVTCGAASNQMNTTPQQAYDAVLATHEAVGTYTYYNWSWELFGLLTMSGNYPNLLANNGGTGGAPGTGGASSTGGVTSTGGTTSTGGVTSTGGMTSTGGVTSTGGMTSTGGTTSTGGVTSTGGLTSTGGVTSTGGMTSTGGVTSTGGATSTGGVTSTGGKTSTGGSGSVEPCVPTKTISGGQSGNFGTALAYCFRTSDTIHGWGCSNFSGRTLQLNDKPMTCGAMPVPTKFNGYYYFEASAGNYPWASIYWW